MCAHALVLLCQPLTLRTVSDLFSKMGFGGEDWGVDTRIPDSKEEWGGVEPPGSLKQ